MRFGITKDPIADFETYDLPKLRENFTCGKVEVYRAGWRPYKTHAAERARELMEKYGDMISFTEEGTVIPPSPSALVEAVKDGKIDMTGGDLEDAEGPLILLKRAYGFPLTLEGEEIKDFDSDAHDQGPDVLAALVDQYDLGDTLRELADKQEQARQKYIGATVKNSPTRSRSRKAASAPS